MIQFFTLLWLNFLWYNFYSTAPYKQTCPQGDAVVAPCEDAVALVGHPPPGHDLPPRVLLPCGQLSVVHPDDDPGVAPGRRDLARPQVLDAPRRCQRPPGKTTGRGVVADSNRANKWPKVRRTVVLVEAKFVIFGGHPPLTTSKLFAEVQS